MLNSERVKIAVMQPYIFPYIGYFQLIHAVSTFVFYDDVNFIKGGWINRNRILVGERDYMFTVPIHKASQNKKIKDIQVSLENYNKWKEKFFRTLQLEYSSAPLFDTIYPMIESFFNKPSEKISLMAQSSIKLCCTYLGLQRDFVLSSSLPILPELPRANRLIAITKLLNSRQYINLPGGADLYEKAYFTNHNVDLSFLYPKLDVYEQNKSKAFYPGLSIIDVMMNNSKGDILEMLESYILE